MRACGLCGHDPACGMASAWEDDTDGEAVALCHEDDHSCYHRWTVYRERGEAMSVKRDREDSIGIDPVPARRLRPYIEFVEAFDAHEAHIRGKSSRGHEWSLERERLTRNLYEARQRLDESEKG